MLNFIRKLKNTSFQMFFVASFFSKALSRNLSVSGTYPHTQKRLYVVRPFSNKYSKAKRMNGEIIEAGEKKGKLYKNKRKKIIFIF